jgi:predicted RNA-binding Zn-ribbon protein involved in translation (DUF1610 family)
VASRIAHQSTVQRLKAVKCYYESLDEMTARLRFTVSKGTLSRVLREQSVSEFAENDIRVKLGLEPMRTHVVEACPDCGAPHVGRCHGKPVAAVVVLSAGERVVKAGTRKRNTDGISAQRDEIAATRRTKERLGLTMTEYLRRARLLMEAEHSE